MKTRGGNKEREERMGKGKRADHIYTHSDKKYKVLPTHVEFKD